MPILAPPPKKILTVEDNAIVSADVRSILETAGYEVCPDAIDGEQAIEHVRAYAPDLILLDLTLPRLDGVDAASRIRKESNAPILVLKPFSEHGLLDAVRSRLAAVDADDFSLRCLIETMHREGADERAIVRAVQNAMHPDSLPRRPGGLQRLLRRLGRFVTPFSRSGHSGR